MNAEVVRNEGVKFKFKHVSEKEVYVELKNLKRKKAQGLDDFPPGLLKDATSSLRNHLLTLSPCHWKKG